MGDLPGHEFRGNQWTDSKAGGGTRATVARGDWDTSGVGTRRWRGMDVDAEFVGPDGSSPILERLNAVSGINVTSTNAGHPPGGAGIGAGATEEMGLTFHVAGSGKSAEREAEGAAEALRATGASVETHYWGGPHGNWVTHVDGKPRLDYFSADEIGQYATDRATVSVTSKEKWRDTTRPERDSWWDRTIGVLESRKS
jgi:hypothetical protein